MIRQGDVLLIPVMDTKKLDVEPMPKDTRGVVLAEGETSGHFHAVFGGHAKLFRFKDGRADMLLDMSDTGIVRVVGGGSGGVDRHTPINIGKGKFIVRTQRRWDSQRVRQVQD